MHNIRIINNNLRYFAISMVLFLGLAVLFATRVNALTVSPPRMELAGNPGTNVVGEFALFNEQDTAKTLYSSFENFEARGESGAPYFIGCKAGGFCSWIKTDSQITLEPGERKTVPLTISIPQNAEPGGHFAAVFWSSAPPQSQAGGQVAIGAKVGILLLLRVAGAVEEVGGILEFRTDGGKFLTSLPITFVYRFSNDGGDRIKPEGAITVKNILGLRVASIDANKGEGNILPRSARKLTALWHSQGQEVTQLTKKEELALLAKISEEGNEKNGFFETAGNQWRNFAFGPYKAKLDLTYGKDNKTAEASYWFFVIPWQLLSIIIVILVLLGLGGWFGLKKYNRWIISKVTQQK